MRLYQKDINIRKRPLVIVMRKRFLAISDTSNLRFLVLDNVIKYFLGIFRRVELFIRPNAV